MKETENNPHGSVLGLHVANLVQIQGLPLRAGRTSRGAGGVTPRPRHGREAQETLPLCQRQPRAGRCLIPASVLPPTHDSRRHWGGGLADLTPAPPPNKRAAGHHRTEFSPSTHRASSRACL